MSSTSPLPPAPNAQRLAPQLPRLLWRELHLLTPLWIALYALGALLLLGFFLTLQPFIYIKSSDIAETIFGVTGFSSAIFLVTSLLVTFAAERESDEDKFSFHRGFSPSPIYAVKIALPLVMLLVMIAALITTGYLTANLRSSPSFVDPSIQNYETPSPDLFATVLWISSLAVIVAAWTILFSLITRKVIHALLLTLAALIANYIYCIFIDQLLVSSPLRTPATFSLAHALTFCMLTLLPLMMTTAVLYYRSQLLELLSRLSLPRTPRAAKPIPVTTNPPPLETSTWKHLGWLHLREQYPLLIAASVVTITAVIQPILTTYQINQTFFGNLEKYPFYVASILFLLFSSTFTFSPEHAHSNYRFWSDRGLSPTLIFRSRMLRYSLILLTTLGVSVILFTTTDAIINRNNSLLFAFDSGQLFNLDDTTKTTTLFFAQYLLTAIPVGIFWSWICRQLIMSIVMTAFSMLFCFAYGNWASISNDWPYLVTHAPFLIAIIACIWYLFPERFRTQSRTRLWLLPTLAAPLALFMSIGDILIYRVLEVPYIFAFAGDVASHETRESTVVTTNNDTFTAVLTSISDNLKPAPIPDLGSIATIEHNFKVECFGWSHLHPDLQTWTQQHRELATQLQKLLTETPISEMTVPITKAADSTFQLAHLQTLLIYHAKLLEHEGNRDQAWLSYVAADRFAEFTTMFNSAYIDGRLLFRATVTRHLASFVAHKDFNRDHLNPFLRFGFDRLPDAPYWQIQRQRTFNQLHDLDIPTGYPTPLWTHLPTERWRYQRLLAHWIEDLYNRNIQLHRLSHSKSSDYTVLAYGLHDSYDAVQRSHELTRLQNSTPIFEIYGGQFDWSVDPITDMQDDHDALVQLTNAQARLLIILAQQQTNTQIISIDQISQYFHQVSTNSESDKAINKFLTETLLKIELVPQKTNLPENELPNNAITRTDDVLLPPNTQRTINAWLVGETNRFQLPLPEPESQSLAIKELQ